MNLELRSRRINGAGELVGTIAVIDDAGKLLFEDAVNFSKARQREALITEVATRTWSLNSSMAHARGEHTATLLPDGRVLVAGGRSVDDQGTVFQILASGELYDPSTGTWSSAGDMAQPRLLHTATLLSSGKVLVAGGFWDGAQYIASAELYDQSTGTWSWAGR